MIPSTIKQYSESKNILSHKADWITSIILCGYFLLVAEHARPFSRQFSLDDITISHPFTEVERVSGIQCLLIAAFVPVITMIGVTAVKNRSIKLNMSQIKLLEISVLGLGLAITISGVSTDLLKNWIGKPRPDFLARCGPKDDTPINELVDISVCTAPLGALVLMDGMRSTPSGHSSISFSSLVFLTLWLIGQSRAFQNRKSIGALLTCFLPLVLASYIALSRTQDYRHHFHDIIAGAFLGNAVGIAIYFRYFNSLWSNSCDDYVGTTDLEDMVLPI